MAGSMTTTVQDPDDDQYLECLLDDALWALDYCFDAMSPEWGEVWNELHTIQCMVGDQMCRIDRGLYLDVIMQLEEHCRAQGLKGSALHVAVEEALPHRMAQVLDGTSR
jgi:hypothetical protein